ncbi:MAG: OmpA family protein [Spirosomataceae bacterium]
MKTYKITFKSLLVYLLSVILMQGLSDCKSTSLKSSDRGENNSSTSKTGISKSKSPADYAIKASAVGGLAGNFIEKYMDKQATQLSQDLAFLAQVERKGEGIKVTLNTGILFKDNSYSLIPDPQASLKRLSETLNIYKDTEILVAGHTSNIGDEKQNQALSVKRAASFADFLQAHGVSPLRIVTQGFGENTPKVSNGSEAGQRQNNRIELAVIANPTLKEQAKTEAAASRVSKK